MSTRARVGVQLATGEIKSVYVWRDGNPDTLGTTLNEYYATPEKAAALVKHGNLIDVEQTLRPAHSNVRRRVTTTARGSTGRSPLTCGSGSTISVTSTSTATEHGAIGRSAHSRPPTPLKCGNYEFGEPADK